MRVVLFVIIFCVSVNGDCSFNTDPSKALYDKLKKWEINNKNFTVTINTVTYQIGVCIEPDHSQANGAIIRKDGNESYVLGLLNQANLVGQDNWMILTYENGKRYNSTCFNNQSSASIVFICGQDTSKITFIQEHISKESPCTYMFQIQVPGLCPDVPQVKKGLSAGAIIFIILLCLASVYLIGGFLFMRIKRGARGIDQIPNLEIWRRVGNSAADGCDFCCRCKSGTPRAGYFIDESGPDLRGDDDILAP